MKKIYLLCIFYFLFSMLFAQTEEFKEIFEHVSALSLKNINEILITNNPDKRSAERNIGERSVLEVVDLSDYFWLWVSKKSEAPLLFKDCSFVINNPQKDKFDLFIRMDEDNNLKYFNQYYSGNDLTCKLDISKYPPTFIISESEPRTQSTTGQTLTYIENRERAIISPTLIIGDETKQLIDNNIFHINIGQSDLTAEEMRIKFSAYDQFNVDLGNSSVKVVEKKFRFIDCNQPTRFIKPIINKHNNSSDSKFYYFYCSNRLSDDHWSFFEISMNSNNVKSTDFEQNSIEYYKKFIRKTLGSDVSQLVTTENEEVKFYFQYCNDSNLREKLKNFAESQYNIKIEIKNFSDLK